MAGKNNFYPYGESSTNILNNSEYQTDQERTAGAARGAIARSKIYNKALRQGAAGAYAVADLVAAAGKDADDASAATLAENFRAAVSYQARAFVASAVSVSGELATATVDELAATAKDDLPALFSLAMVLDQSLPAGSSIKIASSLPDTDLTFPIYSGGEALEDDVITAGAISLMIDTIGGKAFFRAGGAGVNETLPAQVTNFMAVQVSGAQQVTVSWTKSTPYFSGILIMKKAGSAPTGVKDGTQVYKGTGTSFTDSAVSYGTTYYYRAFPYNSKGQYQTEYNVTNVTLTRSVSLSSKSEGTLIRINENGSPQLFYLAQHNYQSNLNGNGRTLMVRKDIYSLSSYDYHDDNVYAGSTVDNKLTSEYINVFSSAVKSLIGTTKIYSKRTNGVSADEQWNISRSVFLLSFTELSYAAITAPIEGDPVPIYLTLRVAYYQGLAHRYWTRTLVIGTADKVYDIEGSGGYYEASVSIGNTGIRPAFTLPANATLNPVANSDGSYTLIES